MATSSAHRSVAELVHRELAGRLDHLQLSDRKTPGHTHLHNLLPCIPDVVCFLGADAVSIIDDLIGHAFGNWTTPTNYLSHGPMVEKLALKKIMLSANIL